MFLTEEEQRQGRARAGARRQTRRLHSVAALLVERRFEGSFELNGIKHRLVYAPARAEVSNRKLKLTGRLSITDSRGRARSREGVTAVLASTQGGVGGPPPRRKMEGFNLPREEERETGNQLPAVDNTGPFAFCGVMYFHFEPLDARALGVGADLSRVQLNARLAPTDDPARDLHGLYSMAVDSIYGEKPDERASAVVIGEINKILKGEG